VGHSEGDIISGVEVRQNKVTVHRGRCLRGLLRRTFSVEYDAAIDLGELDESILVTPYILNVVPALWLLGAGPDVTGRGWRQGSSVARS
jgi:hypothetical protein